MIRQGDLRFVKVRSLPKDAVRVDNPILALGEVTGHAHVVKEGLVYVLPNGNVYVESPLGETLVVHDEHAPIRLEKGFYRLFRQREYNSGEIRRVQD